MTGFANAVEIILRHEGGDSDHPADPGGFTKFGISKRAYPQIDIPHLTIEEAKAIYRRDYWDRCRCDELPYALSLPLFDAAVNCGPFKAIVFLQAALGVAADGAIGAKTIEAARALDADGCERVLVDMMTRRLKHYAALPMFDVFGRGWFRRSLETFLAAVHE